MALLSKFYQVTQQVILEYRTDKYLILKNSNTEQALAVYVYQGKDGNQYCLPQFQINNWKYTDEAQSTYYYGGKSPLISITPNTDTTTSDLISGYFYINNQDTPEGYLIKDKEHSSSYVRNTHVNYDTIRLYIATGYHMNTIAGYSVKVMAPVTIVTDVATGTHKRILKNNYLTLLDWYMPKESLKDKIKWLDLPIFFTNGYYDRYIEIQVISAYDLAITDRDRNIDYVYEDDEYGEMRGNVNEFGDCIIEFATVSPEGVSKENLDTEKGDAYITLDSRRQIGIKGQSNADFFGIRIEEDKLTHSILYYPVYGDGVQSKELDLSTMLAIETGVIPIVDMANYDMVNEGMDNFIETYGDDADKVFKWIVINELAITYNYKRIITPDRYVSTDRQFTEYYTNTIDYTGKTADNGAFWRNKFVPYIKEVQGYYCDNIVVQYNCHLYNRMNNMDILKTASMVINEPYTYQLPVINTDNVTKYKIVNKINKMAVTQNVVQNTANDKMIRSYYNVTNLMVKDTDGQIWADGEMTLKIRKTSANYMLRLYLVDDNNVRIPYDLSGPYTYKLVFPAVTGSNIEILPNMDSENYNLGQGTLIYYISGAQAARIMAVPVSDRYFSVMTHIPEAPAEETTLYEGKTDWR